MQEAAAAELDELVALALRPLLETAIFGLHDLRASDTEEWHRAGLEDARERWRMASRIAQAVDRDPEEIKAREATFAEEGKAKGHKLRGARDLNQMAELIDRHRRATPEGTYTKAWRWLFGPLSDRHPPGGAGALTLNSARMGGQFRRRSDHAAAPRPQAPATGCPREPRAME